MDGRFVKVDGPVFQIGYLEFDALVKEVYGREFSFVETQECSNDTSHIFSVREEEKLCGWEAEELKRWVAGEDEWMSAWSLFEDLRAKKLIEPGLYIVDVCW